MGCARAALLIPFLCVRRAFASLGFPLASALRFNVFGASGRLRGRLRAVGLTGGRLAPVDTGFLTMTERGNKDDGAGEQWTNKEFSRRLTRREREPEAHHLTEK